MKRENGYTLVEILITCCVFITVMAAVYTVYAKGLGYSRKLSGEVTSFRAPAVAFDKIYRELLCDSNGIIRPKPSSSSDTPEYVSDYIVFSTFDDDLMSLKVIGYFFDSANSRIIRAEFDNNTLEDKFDSKNVLNEALKSRAIATGIKSMSYIYINYINRTGLVYVTITSESGKKTYSFNTSVFVR